MTIERLTQIIAAYGAAPVRWPERERAAAQALLARSLATGAPAERARLQAALAEAEALDGALAGFASSAHDMAATDAAVARLTAAVAFPPAQVRHDGRFDLFALFHMIFKPAAAVGATMAALGLFVGFAVDPAYSSGDGSDYTVSQSADAAFSALGQDNGDAAP